MLLYSITAQLTLLFNQLRHYSPEDIISQTPAVLTTNYIN
jgi:hypothetical protein